MIPNIVQSNPNTLEDTITIAKRLEAGTNMAFQSFMSRNVFNQNNDQLINN